MNQQVELWYRGAHRQAVARTGNPQVVVHNAAGHASETFCQIDAETLHRNF